MRCKKHPVDVSSSVGVCATCLRERLLALIAAQTQAEAKLASAAAAALHGYAKSDAPPPPPPKFPRSVSPYVSRRKSGDVSSAAPIHHHLPNQFDPRFYSTPQVGPTYNAINGAPSLTSLRSCRRKSASGKLSALSIFFSKSRSRKPSSISDPNNNIIIDPSIVSSRDSYSNEHPSSSSSSVSAPSPSWLSSIFYRRKKQSRMDDHSKPPPCRRVDRGMSPESDANEDNCNRSPSESDHTSESSQGMRSTPSTVAPPSAARRSRPCQVKSMSSLAFCLSPLVRASPNRHWSQKSGPLAPDVPYSGELRGSAKPHIGTAASYCANRSRKLADFGRVNHNR
ncbi:uncharacterized protein [Rutidosis leptorrhynchoides]|uniref:uncharacterized protein n=1 Tax=Rutidosis leptorrhynchoides TaxID=125765 RepID=UPI003A99A0EB